MTLLDNLNEPQKEAVLHTQGPLLILAGAGSGKTRVLTARVAHLIADEGVDPFNILAITFTNKAAEEMKQRIEAAAGVAGSAVWISTFHSCCARILRRYIDRLGKYDGHFSIYDTDDSKGVIKDICKSFSINTKELKEGAILSAISSCKNKCITPEMYHQNAYYEDQRAIAQVYREYEKRLIKNNALDFDDILLRAVQLLEMDREVLAYYQERFKYIHVDEYQDTNGVQFRLIELLSGKYRNLCVVGDDDQSIYKFRGADITNILSFEHVFPNARVIRLEQNYRSTQNILNAANSVICNNRDRKSKTLWSENGDGEPIRLRQLDTALEEADFIIDDIRRKVRGGECSYKDNAVLYRTNAQSRLLEEKCVDRGIPYQIVGGVNFYSRKEIKDILAYLKTVDNGVDDVALKRIINVPKRGIGSSTITKIADCAAVENMSMFDAMRASDRIPELMKTSAKLKKFVLMIDSFRAGVPHRTIRETIENILEVTGYIEELEAGDPGEAKDRKENILEFINKAVSYQEEYGDKVTLSRFLEEVALVADIDNADMGADRVMLMTLHGAKGLEFPSVYLSGMEDGLFPGFNAIMSGDRSEVEEERRLAYVGITRAKERLTLSCARSRMTNGQTRYNSLSRFVLELSSDLLDPEGRNIVKHIKEMKKMLDDSRLTSFEYTKAGVTGEPQARVISKVKMEDPGPLSSIPGVSKGFGTLPRAKAKLGTPQEHKPYIAKKLGTATVLKKGAPVMTGRPDYDAGDRVRHVKYGQGTVLSVEEAPKDYRVTVDFDKGGKRVLLAAFAKLEKV